MKLMGLLLGDAPTSEIETALKPEPGLTINLLRMTNSVGSGSSEKITSLGHAITVLGRRQLQRWLQLLVFSAGSPSGTSNPLLLLSATRGRLMELLAGKLQPGEIGFADQAFMAGIMSLMPALVGQPIAEIVAPLGLTANVRDALCAGSGPLGALLRLAESSESGDISGLTVALGELPGLSPKAEPRPDAGAAVGKQYRAGSNGVGSADRYKKATAPEQRRAGTRLQLPHFHHVSQTMDSTQHNPQFRQGTSPGPLAKLAAFVLSAAFMVLAFMFSLVALAVVAVLGVALGGWLWWKTRTLRRQMREMREAQQMGAEQPVRRDQVIEGEFIRETGPEQPGPEQHLR
jgi:hypothetical protein